MKKLNNAVNTGRIKVGDDVKFENADGVLDYTVQSITEHHIVIGDGSSVISIPLASSVVTGEYRITANNLIFHTFERKTLGGE